MSDYPGNVSLSTAVKDRVASTFQQTLSLYKQGRTDEVLAGCNLMLQMDPLFDPAKRLLEKTRNPALPIDVDRLLPGSSATGTGLDQAHAAMTARDFERVVHITTEILTNDLMNDEARVLSDQAREKMEAAPFVDQFFRKCEQHLKDGNLPAARNDLEKARALDPSHPSLARMLSMIGSKESAPAAFDASSFVVETPAAAPKGRGTAQAADFGFTFEEDKPQTPQPSSPFANFAFDGPAATPARTTPPAAPAAAPAGGGFSFDTPVAGQPATPSFSFDGGTAGGPKPANEFDFSTASIETTPEDQKKMDQYLTDGDRAFQSGDYQQAIDLWSRIFLIDVTNEAASERIERAKLRRRETEQKVDGILAAGVTAFEKKDFNTARARFNEVLQSDPHNVSAQDYMDRMASGQQAPSFAPPPSDSSSFGGLIDDEPMNRGGSDEPAPQTETMYEEPSAPRKTSSAAKTPARAEKKAPMTAILAVAAVVLLVAGGFFLWSLFMSKADVTPVQTQGTIHRATILAQQGKFDDGIALLRDIKPGDPLYDTALATIADIQQKKNRAATTVDGRPAAVYYDENVAAGNAAFAANDYVVAKQSFENAMRVKPLPADAKTAYDRAAQQVGKLANAKALFGEGKYQDAVLALQPLLQQEPNNRSIQRMLTDAHFNAGTAALRAERLDEATLAFAEVLKVNPNDDQARRSRELAERYEGQTKDLLFKIYVKYLPLRQPAA